MATMIAMLQNEIDLKSPKRDQVVKWLGKPKEQKEASNDVDFQLSFFDVEDPKMQEIRKIIEEEIRNKLAKTNIGIYNTIPCINDKIFNKVDLPEPDGPTKE